MHRPHQKNPPPPVFFVERIFICPLNIYFENMPSPHSSIRNKSSQNLLSTQISVLLGPINTSDQPDNDFSLLLSYLHYNDADFLLSLACDHSVLITNSLRSSLYENVLFLSRPMYLALFST